MRVRTKMNVSVASGTSNKDKLFSLDDTLSEVVLDGCSEFTSGGAELLDAAVFTVPLAGLGEVRGIYLRATGDFSLALSGGAPIQVKKPPAGAAGAVASVARVMLDAQVTSVVVTAGEDLSLTWCFWGDPVV